MSENINIGAALISIGQAVARPAFELRFNQLQNSMIRRVNDQIDKINEDTDNTRVVAKLEKDRNELVDDVPRLRTFLFGNEANRNRLLDLSTVVISATAKFSEVDDDTNLTADEASDINALKDQIVERLEGLFVIKHAGIQDSNIIEKLTDLVDELNGLTAVAGVVDAEGSGSLSNNNRALLDKLAEAQIRVDVGAVVTQNTAHVTNGLILKFQKKILAIDAEFIGISTVDAQRRIKEIADLRIDSANLLRAISISFEVSASFTDFIARSLSPRQVPPGSVLNLFT